MKKILPPLLLSLGILYLGFGVDRTNFYELITAFTVAFAGYAALVKYAEEKTLRLAIILGIGLRLALVFAFPLLSDDVYRFIWDGLLINDGQNPFAKIPAFYLEAGNEVPGLTPELYGKLNSPEYFTIYPPVAQAIFTLATWISPGSHYWAAVVMKLFLFACELGSLWVLHRLFRTTFSGFPITNLLFYWLNPLIIIEITGNLHFEGAMVFFLLLALYCLTQRRWVRAGLAMAASVASKLLPLLLLPYLIRRLWGRPFWVFSIVFGAALLLLFAPLLAAGFLDGFGSSLDLYFRKFEFNASIYYLAREIGYGVVGWNLISTIGPALAKFAAVAILVLALLDGRSSWKDLPVGWLWAFTIYLLCATTVHPWYLSVPIALCCFTRWRFPLVWSFLITFTYVSYTTVPYRELLWVVAVEYVLVLGFLIWERKRPTPPVPEGRLP
ncbi:glycosyltransferase 87 family protein [Lewinella sp. 4G2]|uniref:glycosyltransferase 87 family protein n=1 Tax=Lewinella sp. 4G2 TaxID=1803372 RepID=UPI0007B46E7D|nr:glycosyltransferase 87 family protein [Lewinella sp. 4G2]OAV43179.1 hypothetical protein A3850_001115 [Lewinella sp. 4G2]